MCIRDSVISDVIFDDNMSAYSESQAWGFEDFEDWELEAYYGIIGSKLDTNTNTCLLYTSTASSIIKYQQVDHVMITWLIDNDYVFAD